MLRQSVTSYSQDRIQQVSLRNNYGTRGNFLDRHEKHAAGHERSGPQRVETAGRQNLAGQRRKDKTMYRKHMTTLLIAAVTFAFAAAASQAAVFAKYDGFDGESKDANHE